MLLEYRSFDSMKIQFSSQDNTEGGWSFNKDISYKNNWKFTKGKVEVENVCKVKALGIDKGKLIWLCLLKSLKSTLPHPTQHHRTAHVKKE